MSHITKYIYIYMYTICTFYWSS